MGCIGVILGLHSGCIGVILGLYRGYIWVIFGIILGLYWGYSWVVLGLYCGCSEGVVTKMAIFLVPEILGAAPAGDPQRDHKSNKRPDSKVSGYGAWGVAGFPPSTAAGVAGRKSRMILRPQGSQLPKH